MLLLPPTRSVKFTTSWSEPVKGSRCDWGEWIWLSDTFEEEGDRKGREGSKRRV
jgi:hypothetical protein